MNKFYEKAVESLTKSINRILLETGSPHAVELQPKVHYAVNEFVELMKQGARQQIIDDLENIEKE